MWIQDRISENALRLEERWNKNGKRTKVRQSISNIKNNKKKYNNKNDKNYKLKKTTKQILEKKQSILNIKN